MVRRSGAFSQRIQATLVVAAPGVLALAILLAAGQVGWVAALAAVAAILLASAPVAAWQLRRLERLLQRIRHLAESGTQDLSDDEALSTRIGPPLEPAVAEADERLRQREAALHAKLASSEAVLSALPDPMILLNAETRLLRLNTAAEALFGQRREGRGLVEILRHPGVVEAAERACRGETVAGVEFQLPGAIERSFQARLIPLDGAGEEAAVLSLHELTAIRRAERLRGDFVANASHELRTPLASLVGFIETLRGPARDDATARARFLSIMEEQAQRMARLIEDLLSLSRIELDEHTPPKDRVDLGQILRSTVSALEIQARKKQMRIQLELEGAPEVLGNEDELNQLFQNLVDNAVKYGRPQTEVRVVVAPVAIPSEISGREDSAGVKVSVIDQGEGIARADIPRLTERFYRVDKARSRALGGTGLGLAIVKHIANRHRGRLTIESQPGEGSCFSIQLPLAGNAPAQVGRSAQPAAE
ncbi:MAG: ATP-binding protein [Kiloniellales bacterium]|nr:ATP-binding protein [Kiloniellales bacterium]